jgi:predicted amidophosphoribosyltransferase
MAEIITKCRRMRGTTGGSWEKTTGKPVHTAETVTVFEKRPASEHEIICPACGTANKREFEHCVECGQNLYQNCPKCGNAQ